MRYRDYGRLDDQVLEDGDAAFRGINSFASSTTLPEGTVTKSENMRLDGGDATLRPGLSFKSGAINPFTYSAGTDQVFASINFKASDGTEYIALATRTKVILWNEANNTGVDIDYPGGEVVASGDNANFVQSFTKLILFRGTGKRPLEWDGDNSNDFVAKTGTATNPSAGTAMPSSEFGLSFRNRIVVPLPSDSAFSINFSDILDDNQFDTTSIFRISKGLSPVVGFAPYLENQLLVFQERAITLVSDVANIDSASTFEITREYGCVARKTIVASGPQYYFLSDRGVMVLQQGLDPAKGLGVAVSKVSGEAKPLSEPILDEFQDINAAAVSGAVATVFDNKVFFAVPTGTSTVNNVCAVYDILTNSWVSKDIFPSGFQIDEFVELAVGTDPKRRELFIVNPTGIYQYTSTGATVDDSGRFIGSSSESGTTAISGILKTRSFTFRDRGVKHWKGGQLAASTTSGDSFSINFETKDPDNGPTSVLTHTASGTEEALFRFGSRTRGYSCSVQVTISAGNPTIRHLLVQGAVKQLGGRKEIA